MNKIHLSSIDSTNTYLKENYEKLDNYTFVSTDEQTNGRGRNSRVWKSENGKNLLFSLLILDKKLIEDFKEISILSAYSIIQVLEKLGINNLSIKWPNDIYYKDKKICGILLEAVTKSKMECLIIGVGLNVNQKEFNDEYLTTPTSIMNVTNKEIDINQLKEDIYNQLINNLEAKKNNKDFYEEISKYDYLKNKEAYALIENNKTRIKVIGINKDYSLNIEYENINRNIESGEISFHI